MFSFSRWRMIDQNAVLCQIAGDVDPVAAEVVCKRADAAQLFVLVVAVGGAPYPEL